MASFRLALSRVIPLYIIALFPILHLVADLGVIKELSERPGKLSRSLVVGGNKVDISQAVFVEKDQVIQYYLNTTR